MDLEVFRIPLKVLKIFGLWITKKSSKFYAIYGLFVQYFFIFQYTAMMGLAAVNLSGIIDFADQSSYFCTFFVCCFKCVNFNRHCDNLEVLFSDIQRTMIEYDWNEIHIEPINRAYKFLKAFWIAVFGTCIFGGIVPFLTDQLAYKMWFPYSLDVPALYYLSAFYQLIDSTCAASANVMMDMMPVLLIGYHIAMLEDLMEKLRSIKEPQELRKCIQYQLKIIELAERTEDIFSTVIFIQGMCASVVLCMSSFAMTFLVFPEDFGVAFKFVSYIIAILAQIYIPCLYGTELKLTYDKVSEVFFHTDWFDRNMEFKLYMKMLMEHSKHSLRFLAFGNFRIDLRNFGKVCNSAYSLFSVFKKAR